MKISQKHRDRMEKAPVPKAHGHHHHTFSSIQAAYIFVAAQVLLGAACLLFTEQIHEAFPIILGSLMAVTGISQVIRGIVTEEYRSAETKLTSWGIVNLVLGIVILVHYRSADQIIGAVWGMIGLVKGSEVLNLAIHQWATGKAFVRKLLHGGVELALGILLLLDPLHAVEHHLFILGMELILQAVQSVPELRKRKGESV